MAGRNQIPQRRESDPRLSEIEKQVKEIEKTVIAGEVAFKRHEEEGRKRSESIQKSLTEIGTILAELKVMQDDVAKHELLLYGDGNGKVGIIVKMDRLIGAIEDLKKVAWLVFATFATAAIGLVINAMIHAAKP